MISRKRPDFEMHFQTLKITRQEKADISTASISETGQFALK